METTERSFSSTRGFDAQRELLWQAGTDPQRLAQWWGPPRFPNPIGALDVRPGGAHRVVVRSPVGVDYPIRDPTENP
jgi:uncharacterized protein YndB with AHSA1/START domain